MENYEDNTEVIGTEDGEYIYNSSSGSTVEALEGDDQIENDGNYIDGGEGYDEITSYGDYNTIVGGESIEVSGEWNVVNAGDGVEESALINVSGSSNIIAGAESTSNEIYVNGSENEITGGEYDDHIVVEEGYENIVNGGGGDDTIESYGSNVVFGGDGADTFVFNGDGTLTISDYEEGDTIQINLDIYDSVNYEEWDGITINIGEEGSIVIENGYDFVDESGFLNINLVNANGDSILVLPLGLSFDGETLYVTSEFTLV